MGRDSSCDFDFREAAGKVEIFSDFEDEGRTFEGSTVANGNGNWSLDVSPAGPNLTATATDGAGNTSEFSLPVAVGRRWVRLPLVLRPAP